MKKKKYESRDRLSELPDSLIFEIFWFLPMTDVVRTTVLSRRWKNLWTTSPNLNFKDCYMRDSSPDFVKWALIFWRGTRILKLKIIDARKSLDMWVRFAKEKQVKELYVHDLEDEEYEEETYWAPQCLYSCSSLKELSLRCCKIKTHGNNVHWNQLKSLTIDGRGAFISEDAINQILCGSPQLQDLTMMVMENSENLSMSIQSTSLKYLCIDKYLDYDNGDPSTNTELRIWTPNLEELEISGVPYSKCLLMNVSSLTRVTLGFNIIRCFGAHPLIFSDDFLGETLSQILPDIRHVKHVILSDWCIKVMRGMINKYMLSPLPDVKFLQLYTVASENTKK